MTYTIRLLLMVFANALIVMFTLYWLHSSGIDINNTTLIENADNLFFIMDYITFLVLSFGVNAAILSIPARKNRALKKLVDTINIQNKYRNYKRRQHI